MWYNEVNNINYKKVMNKEILNTQVEKESNAPNLVEDLKAKAIYDELRIKADSARAKDSKLMVAISVDALKDAISRAYDLEGQQPGGSGKETVASINQETKLSPLSNDQSKKNEQPDLDDYFESREWREGDVDLSLDAEELKEIPIAVIAEEVKKETLLNQGEDTKLEVDPDVEMITKVQEVLEKYRQSLQESISNLAPEYIDRINRIKAGEGEYAKYDEERKSYLVQMAKRGLFNAAYNSTKVINREMRELRAKYGYDVDRKTKDGFKELAQETLKNFAYPMVNELLKSNETPVAKASEAIPVAVRAEEVRKETAVNLDGEDTRLETGNGSKGRGIDKNKSEKDISPEARERIESLIEAAHQIVEKSIVLLERRKVLEHEMEEGKSSLWYRLGLSNQVKEYSDEYNNAEDQLVELSKRYIATGKNIKDFGAHIPFFEIKPSSEKKGDSEDEILTNLTRVMRDWKKRVK